MDHSGRNIQITDEIDIKDEGSLVRAMNPLRSKFPNSTISLVEQNNLLGG